MALYPYFCPDLIYLQKFPGSYSGNLPPQKNAELWQTFVITVRAAWAVS